MVKIGGLKKASLYDHFEGLTTDSYLAKEDPLGGGWIGLKQPVFLSNLSSGGLVLPNKSQLSNLQNGHTEILLLTPHF